MPSHGHLQEAVALVLAVHPWSLSNLAAPLKLSSAALGFGAMDWPGEDCARPGDGHGEGYC